MILTCDIGSSFTKVALIDRQELVCASYRKPLKLEQQDSAAWSHILGEIAQVLQSQTTQSLEAFCFSSHGPSLIAIDKTDQPMGIIHRSDPDIRDFRGGSSFYLPLARALWQRLDTEKERVAWILPPVNYLCYCLTGDISVPVPENYRNFYWAQDWCQNWSQDSHSLDAEFLHLLPPLSPFIESVGTVSQAAVGRFQLPQNTVGLPVFCPGVDFFAAEAGLSHSSDAMLRNRTGTSEGFNLLLPDDSPEQLQHKLDSIQLPSSNKSSHGFFLSRHVISDRMQLCYLQEGTGNLFAQLFDLWSKSWPNSIKPQNAPLQNSALQCSSWQRCLEAVMLQDILQEAKADGKRVREARNLARKFMQSGQEPTNALLYAEQLPFPELGLFVLQVLVEYFCQNCELLFSVYEQYSGQRPKEVLLSGGQAYYPNWLAWKARESGIVLHIPSICEAEFIGAASICFYQLGYFSSIEHASAHFFRIAQTYR